MKEKKNIDNFFQDKFKDFEVVPDEHIWANIEEKLKEKKRRVIPFWWKISGIAASLLIGFLITNALFFNSKNGETRIVIQEKKSTKIENSKNENQAVVANEINTSEDKSNPNNLSKDHSKSTLNNSETNKNSNRNSLDTNKDQVNINNAIVASEVKSSRNKSTRDSKTTQNKTIKYADDIVYEAGKKKKGNINPNESKSKKETSLFNTNKPADSNSNPIATVEKKEVVQPKNTFENAINNNENKIVIEDKNTKNNFNQVVAENKIIDIKNIDTTKIAVVANALEELLKEKEKESKKKAESKLNRWQIATNVAPIYFSSTSGGSPLDSKFVSNDKKYEPSYSYGLGVNYALNKKWSIRTGVNSLAFEYNTNDVVFFQNTNASRIQNVKSNLQGSLIEIQNKSSVIPPEVGLNSAVIEKYDGSINQKMGYLEIPLEMSYQLVDKKFGLQIISGFSSLILNQNSVAVQSNGQVITIGEATNLNDIHFSGNVGFGVRYRFLKSFNANLNPMFKYQFNTFSNDSGNFKPYLFGLYTGISYTF